MDKWTESRLVALLARRHEEDLFVAGCRNGPSSGKLRILDGWAMKRSWSPVTFYGYEVKVSRSDFMRDSKWVDYLPLCHEFYFVSPPQLIKAEELPPEAGLLWATTGGTRLVIRKKAPRRSIDMPTNLMVYLLMSRTKIVGDMHEANQSGESKLAYWRNWLEEGKAKKQLGYGIRSHIAQMYNEIRMENLSLKRKMEGYDSLKKQIESLGLDLEHTYVRDVQHRLENLGGRELAIKAASLSSLLNEFSTELLKKVPNAPSPKPGVINLRLPQTKGR